MWTRVRRIFAPPSFPEEEDKTRKARYANVIAFAFLGIALAYEAAVRVFDYYTGLSILDLILFGVAALCLIGLILLRRGYVALTSMLLVVLTWAASNGLAATGYGAKDASYIVNFAIILMAGLLLGWQGSLVFTALSILSGLALAYAEQSGLVGVTDYPVTLFVRDVAFVFGLSWVFIYLLINGLENALRRSRTNLAQLQAANTSLNTTQKELQNRSVELLSANQQLENRTKKLHAIAIVTRTAAAIQDFDLLLSSITSTISRQLDYYYVGLFLLDEQREFAILRSANTDAGQKLLSQGYRIPVGKSVPIRLVAQTGRPYTIPGQGPALSEKLSFPETRSQLLLPLKSAEQVVGFLDIQSSEEQAFSEDDISILSILTDQVAITIQNLLLYEQSQNALRQADLTSQQISAQAWKAYEKAIQAKGYRYDGIKSEPLKDSKPINDGNNSLAVPIELRGQTIGSFHLNPSDPARGWTDDELVIVRATAERVALALEGARLLDEAQKRATREAFLSDVATKLSASFQLDSILRDTVQELGQTLKNSTVTFQLINPSALPTASEPEKSNGHTSE